MGSKKSPNMWKDTIDTLHFTDTLDTVKEKIEQVSSDYTFTQFIKDCEAFYNLYIDFIGFNDDRSPSKNLQIQFHKVARLLNMYGHVPDAIEAEATESMFDYLSSAPDVEKEMVKTSSSNVNQDDFYLQNNLVFGLSNDMITDNVELIDVVNDKPTVKSCKILNIKISALKDVYNKQYLHRLAEFYKVHDKLIKVSFDRDKMIYSMYYK